MLPTFVLIAPLAGAACQAVNSKSRVGRSRSGDGSGAERSVRARARQALAATAFPGGRPPRYRGLLRG